jgi:hypothetical protein
VRGQQDVRAARDCLCQRRDSPLLFPKKGLRENRDFCFAFKLICPVQTPFKKDFGFPLTQITRISPAVPSPRGAACDRHETRDGMRWTRQRRRAPLARGRAARSVRRSRVVLTPRRWRQVLWIVCKATVARKPGHRGEHEVSRRRAGKAGLLPLNLYARVRFFRASFAHEIAGAARTRLSPRPPSRVALRPPISLGATMIVKLGRTGREIARACQLVASAG